jgi:hypothetical protein
MNRLATLAAVAIVSAVATPVVVSATGVTSNRAPEVALRSSLPAAEATQPAQTSAPEASCSRRVRVVYPGAGVPNGTACAPASGVERG